MKVALSLLGNTALAVLALILFFPAGAHAQMMVDCSGATPNAYPTINAALANVTGPGTTILVSGTCTENVYLNGVFNLSLGAWWGQTATIVGGVTVNTSNSVYLYGLNVTNSAGSGFTVNTSQGVTLDKCASNGSLQNGLSISNFSEVTVVGSTTFDNNGAGGVHLFGESLLNISNFDGASTDISNNKGPGIWMSQANVIMFGNTTLANNLTSGDGTQGFGLLMYGASRVQIGTCAGPNLIEGNQAGGIFIEENSEISLFTCGNSYQNFIQGNGPVGISAGFGSQVTLADNVQITKHAGPAVDLFGNSQLNALGPNLISQNGMAGDPRTAAIRVDGNSEAFLRGGQISNNFGPAILALVNSSADFTGVSFAGNTGGIISCDISAFMVSDLATGPSGVAPGALCRTPHNLGNHHFPPVPPTVQNCTAQKNRQGQYKKLATPNPH
jgi:hypothetical protein